MNIKFYKPYTTGKELKYISQIFKKKMSMSGDGYFTKKVQDLFEKRYGTRKALLTTSGTTALEMAVRLSNFKKGDEVIVPSFTFSSTVNAILLSHGVRPVFAEVEEPTLNIDPEDIERKITKKTKALMLVHYAGVACEMDKIMQIAKKYKLIVIEDAAQAIDSTYKGKYLGTFGDFGCFSFHDTKNISCGEGGALFINTPDTEILEMAEIIREKGTNRSRFIRGEIDKYTWVETGSSYLPSDLLAAYLLAQMESVEKIISLRKKVYDYYANNLAELENEGFCKLPKLPRYAVGNGHIFYILLNSNEQRNTVMDFVKSKGVAATFHYIPLHSAPRGQRLGYKEQDLPITEDLAGRLLRLPIHSGMRKAEYSYVVSVLKQAAQIYNIQPLSRKEVYPHQKFKFANFLFQMKGASYEK